MSDTMRDAIAVLLAGGQGERLWPLTRDRAKPAVPFGALYRIIDITLSNCINSSLRRVFILTQYKALSLSRHVRAGWSPLAAQPGCPRPRGTVTAGTRPGRRARSGT